MNYLKAFVVGGLFCVIGQIFIDKTKLTPAKNIGCVCGCGVFLQMFGWYQKLVDFAGLWCNRYRLPDLR